MAHRTSQEMLPRLTTTPNQNPALATVSGFIRSIFPVLERDVTFLYHTPRHLPDPHYIAVRKVILSITPTPGFYSSLDSSRSSRGECNLAFLHRPWALERRRLPKSSTVVLACHKAFDQEVTVGANFALAERLEMDGGKGVVVKGYKGNEGRRIGVVAGFAEGVVVRAEEVRLRVRREFGDDSDGEFGLEDGVGGENGASRESGAVEADGVGIRVVAIMNAFHPDEVERVARAALEMGLVEAVDKCAGLLYLTGGRRDEGIAAARAKGMRVICVGHRVCELWGIKYLAQRLEQEFPAVEVVVVDEEEVQPTANETPVPV